MQILGFSVEKWDIGRIVDDLSEALGGYVDFDRLVMPTVSGGSVRFDRDVFAGGLRTDGISGFYQDGVISGGVDISRFNDSQFVFPFSKLDVNLYNIVEKDVLMSILEAIATPLKLDLAFVIEDEKFILDYNASKIGIGLGLVDVYWINLYGEKYKNIVNLNDLPAMCSRKSIGSGSVQLLAVADRYDEFLKLTESQKDQIKMIVGGDLFVESKEKLDKKNSNRHSSSWVLNPSNVFGALKWAVKACREDPFQGQAKIVPACFKRR